METSKLISDKLGHLIDNPKSELVYSNNFELLIAVMLSAQCTDKRVNIITEKLFKKYTSPNDFANANLSELENDIKSCNYFHNKAKNIILTSRVLVDKFNSQVPNNHSDLLKLPGVGNKTANVVLGVGFNIPAFPVDTHVLRVSNRLGLVKTKDVLECEETLKGIFNPEEWIDMHHKLLLFGRYYCTARNPKCDNCDFKNVCKFKEGVCS